jgi:hypothetical protein
MGDPSKAMFDCENVSIMVQLDSSKSEGAFFMSHIIPIEDLKNTSDTSSKLDMYQSLMTSEQQIREGKVKKASVDWDSFVIPSERGKNVDAYMKEMRENDRL